MASGIPTPRRAHKDAFYTQEEIQVIRKHKEEYRQQTTREERGHIFRTKILVDLFNYWLVQNMAPESEAESIARIKVNSTLSII